jgi:ATP-dependent exoDNAse (exonuclease V) beta subunit
MTRAEAALFITASLPEQTQGEREEADPADAKGPEDFIRTRLAQLGAKGTGGPQSFLDLLLPALNSRENPPFSIEAIPVLSREELRRRAGSAGNRQVAGTAAAMLAAAERAAPLYAGAEAVPPPPEAAAPVPASSLRYTGPVSAALEAAPAAASAEDAALDRLLKQSGLDSAEFGSIAHGFIEARFRNRPPGIPPRLLAKAAEGRWDALGARAQAMADRFFASELGRLSLAAPYREAEFPVLTFWGDKGAPLPISGQIDLLFESAGTMHVADFKTDRAEAPAEHLAQLAVYGRAVADIFGKPVRCWLFYLRSGRAVELTASLDRVDIEQLVLREASGKTDKTFPESRGANFDTN